MSVLCMKTRTVLLLLTLIVGSVTVSFLLIRQDNAHPTWTNIVSETHKQLNRLKKLNEKPGLHKVAEAEPYLKKLGFDESELGSPSSDTDVDRAKVKPVIVIPALSGQGADARGLIDSIRHHLYGYTVLIYDLGLGYFERRSLKNGCNKTSALRCQIRVFDWDSYPSHVQVLKYGAFRPLIIQESLNISGAVLYLTPNHRITSANLKPALERARRIGLAGWALEDSTSSITHHKLYTFFHTKEENFYFHRTVSPDRLLVYSTEQIRRSLMLPWLQCALTYRCVAPVGAQDTGCRTYRKPLYLYSGCHGYDWSVMNLVLGLLFHGDSSPYSEDYRFFVTDKKYATNPTTPSTTTSISDNQ